MKAGSGNHSSCECCPFVLPSYPFIFLNLNKGLGYKERDKQKLASRVKSNFFPRGEIHISSKPFFFIHLLGKTAGAHTQKVYNNKSSVCRKLALNESIKNKEVMKRALSRTDYWGHHTYSI